MSVLQHLPEGSRVAVIRLRSLGDCVLTTPALALLKQTRPDLAIGVSVEPHFSSVFEGNPVVSTILAPRWQSLRSWRPELCLNLHGGNRSQWMTGLSGAKYRAGFANHTITFAYNIRIVRAQRILGVNRIVHTAEHMASAVFALGVPLQEVPRADLYATASPMAGRYAVLHPYASGPDKEWPAERFCEVARYLKLWQINPVFLAGPADDPTHFAAHQVFRGTLDDAKRVISGATVFIGNDSGPAHMAAAFGIPTVVIFGNSNPAIWGPWRTESEIVVAPDGLVNVPVSRVIAALERLRTFQEAHA